VARLGMQQFVFIGANDDLRCFEANDIAEAAGVLPADVLRESLDFPLDKLTLEGDTLSESSLVVWCDAEAQLKEETTFNYLAVGLYNLMDRAVSFLYGDMFLVVPKAACRSEAVRTCFMEQVARVMWGIDVRLLEAGDDAEERSEIVARFAEWKAEHFSDVVVSVDDLRKSQAQ